MDETQGRIRFGLDRTRIADVHSHLGTGRLWQARNLADILSYHWVQVELARAAGRRLVRDPQDPEGFIRQALPFMPLIRNTVNHYALTGILRDLYGFTERMLTEQNWRTVDEAVRAHNEKPGWFNQVLQRAGIAKVGVCHREGKPNPEVDFIPYEYGEYLYAVDSVGCLRQIVGPDAPLPQTPEELQAAIALKIDTLAREQHVRALHVCPYPSDRYPGWSFRPQDPTRVHAALKRLLREEILTPEERRTLISFSAEATSAAAGNHRIVLQMFHGSIAHTDENTNQPSNLSYWDPDFLQTHTLLFAKYPDTIYDLFLGTRIPSHEAAVLVRVYFNVLVSGAWWHAFSPTTMRIMFRDRLEMLPTTAWNAFFSDGYIVEWVYGKQLVTKNVLSHALADMVAEGYITEQDALEMAAQLLYHTPLAVYTTSSA